MRVTEVAERTWAAVERAPAEARRREREDLLRSLFESTDEGVMVIERLPLRADGLRDWRYVAMNAKAGAMFGKPDLSGQSVRDNFPDEDEGWYDIYDHVLETSESIRFERESVPQRMVLEMYLSRVDGPNAPRLIVLLRDVTARRRAVDALTRRKERQAFLLALSDRLRPLADPVEVMAVASEALGRRLGVGRCGYGEVDATDAFLIVEHDWTDGVMASLKGTLRLDDFGPQLIGAYRAGRTVVLEDVLSDARAHGVEAAFEAIGGLRASLAVPLLKDGRWVAALYAQQTRPRRWTADDEELVREVSGRIWAAIERTRAEAAVREADRRKDEFLATLAHELRNPLAPISNALALLKTGSNRVDSTGVVAIIERQVQHMIRLVDDLLDVSRISRGVIELRREPLDLRTVLDAAIETSRPAIEQGRHTLILRMPPDPLPIEGDAVRLAQVFANLLNNAARYSEDGGRIVLTARRERSEALVSVRDTGIGIATEQLTQVFELFGQVNRHHSRAQGGLGIGLNLAQRLVRMHGGSMQASSAGAGHGSVFSVRLPLAAGAGPHGQDAKPEAVSSLDRQRIPVADVKPDAVPNLEGQRILVVDDNRDAAESLALLLRIEGAEAIIEHDGAAALARIGHWPPSVVLLDIGMPGMDGLEAARRIRADRRFDEVMLVALTGWGQDMDRQRTREAGFDH
ncbi:MAG: response regulator, partial [Burkholderiaceae bacterium]|nr:response regulator [Burkholderiaceae bacterium]